MCPNLRRGTSIESKKYAWEFLASLLSISHRIETACSDLWHVAHRLVTPIVPGYRAEGSHEALRYHRLPSRARAYLYGHTPKGCPYVRLSGAGKERKKPQWY